jgi:hypothetical protein
VRFSRLALLACIAPAGCKLIDQTTFAPAPEARPAAPAPQAAIPVKTDPRTPLAVIDYSTPNPAYRELLGYVVRAAQARDRNVQFDVVAATPSVTQVGVAQSQAGEVMRSMMADGIPASRLHLGLQTDPALIANQVRVYVR